MKDGIAVTMIVMVVFGMGVLTGWSVGKSSMSEIKLEIAEIDDRIDTLEQMAQGQTNINGQIQNAFNQFHGESDASE